MNTNSVTYHAKKIRRLHLFFACPLPATILKKQETQFIKMGNLFFGVDQLIQQPGRLKELPAALVTNNAASTHTGESSRLALLKAGFRIRTLFSPEHGLTASGDDGASQPDTTDALTQLPVISLYGDQLRPTAAALAGVDLVFFDIPDAGCRFYTYLWTLTHVMEACAAANKTLVVLDRPNPISGDPDKAEGPMLDEAHCSSFTGRWNIPVRHSCTLGELAAFFAATRVKDLQLEVIKINNWNRKQTAGEAGWYFRSPSPAITDTETALLYPGAGLLEGVNVNEGRGTSTPFKIAGAPWIRAEEMAAAFRDLRLPGISVTAAHFIPGSGIYAGEKCGGLRCTVTTPSSFRPVQTGLCLLQLIKKMYPGELGERLYPTVANPSGKGHLDRLTGVRDSFMKIENGELIKASRETGNWKQTISPFLLY